MKNISEFSAQLDQTFDQGEAVSMEWLFRPLLKCWRRAIQSPLRTSRRRPGSPSRKLSKSHRLYLVWNLMSRPCRRLWPHTGPYPHRFEVDGKQLYAWCALDTLMFPALIGRTAHIASPCHGTGKSVRLTVEPDRVVSVEPSTAVVSIVTPHEMASVRSAFCNDVHFSVH